MEKPYITIDELRKIKPKMVSSEMMEELATRFELATSFASSCELGKMTEDLMWVGESIDNLPKSDKSLSKEERRRKEILLLKKEILDKIKDAREKNEKGQELHHTMVYGLLTSLGEKHPYLMALIQSNLRWSSF